jgi:hypothetical protein
MLVTASKQEQDAEEGGITVRSFVRCRRMKVESFVEERCKRRGKNKVRRSIEIGLAEKWILIELFSNSAYLLWSK